MIRVLESKRGSRKYGGSRRLKRANTYRYYAGFRKWETACSTKIFFRGKPSIYQNYPLNIGMQNYVNDIGIIYENIDFKPSHSGSSFLKAEKAQAEEYCASIEKYLTGTINFYQASKKAYDDNPADMNALKELEGIFKRLRPTLAQYSEFK